MLNSNELCKHSAELDQDWELLLAGYQALDTHGKLELTKLVNGQNITMFTLNIVLWYARVALKECIIRDARRKLEEKDG